jgi:hypothetical protein
VNGEDICHAKVPNILLVEGKKDCRVVRALQEHHALVDDFGIYECNGDDGVVKRLNALISAPETERPNIIGVLLDADTKAIEERWQQVQTKLKKYGYDVPEKPDRLGTVIEKDSYPKIGIWLMPDNVVTGMLEDFLLRSINPSHVEVTAEAVQQAQKAGVTSFKEVHTSKAKLHTFLAWQDEPGTPIGLAITAQILSAESDLCNLFIAWLRKLFN